MIRLKLYTLAVFILLLAYTVCAQDTTKSNHSPTVNNSHISIAIDVEPRFRGNFGAYLSDNLRYPEVDKLVGITDKVFVQFIVEKDGSLSDIKPVHYRSKSLAMEAVRVVSMSPYWIPGIQNSKPVRVMYTVPINFTINEGGKKTRLKDLRNSDYGFVFFIDGQSYSVDQAQEKLGKTFDPSLIEDIEEYYNPQYAMPDKKAVYKIVLKNS
jgi:periplasmic protein TonB